VRRDRARFHTQQRQAELQRAKNNAAVKRRLKALGPRRSGRIHRAYINVDSPGVWTCEQLVAVGNVIENVEKK
jgi:hypothetical protein